MTFLDRFRKRIRVVKGTITLGPIEAGSGYSDSIAIPEAKAGDVVVHIRGAGTRTSLVVQDAYCDSDGIVLVHFANTSNEELRNPHPLELTFLLIKGL